ncbi:MAG: hypothetical protein N3E37_03085 [Candidatus Micrarchaeota archaeon]|nr:hypothetical protein [Candidatus Micrarchaeota archaeon]
MIQKKALYALINAFSKRDYTLFGQPLMRPDIDLQKALDPLGNDLKDMILYSDLSDETKNRLIREIEKRKESEHK